MLTPRFLRRIIFKRQLLRKLERTEWELQANADYEHSVADEVMVGMKKLEQEIMANIAKIDELEKSNKREDRDAKKELQEKVAQQRSQMTELTKQVSVVTGSAAQNANRQFDLHERARSIKKNFSIWK